MKAKLWIVNIILAIVYIYGIANKVDFVAYIIILHNIGLALLMTMQLKRNDGKGFSGMMSPAHLIPGIVTFLMVKTGYRPMEYTLLDYMLILSFGVALAVTVLCNKLVDEERLGGIKKALLFIAVAFIFHAQIFAINVMIEKPEVTTIPAIVEEKYDDYVLRPVIKGYYLDLCTDAESLDFGSFYVNKKEYDLVETGDMLELKLHKGCLGIQYFDHREITAEIKNAV